MIAARILGLAQLGVGATMALRPEKVARLAAGRETPAPPVIVRILGVRTAVQGALTAARPSRVALEVGAGTDALHLLSMITVAVVPKYRRTALVSASVAAASLAGSLGARG